MAFGEGNDQAESTVGMSIETAAAAEKKMIAEREHVNGLVGGKYASIDREEPRPLSSAESAMISLEEEIMFLDESFSSLIRKLKPVIVESDQATASDETRMKDRPGESEIARAIGEKRDRVRSIRERMKSLTYSIDL